MSYRWSDEAREDAVEEEETVTYRPVTRCRCGRHVQGGLCFRCVDEMNLKTSQTRDFYNDAHGSHVTRTTKDIFAFSSKNRNRRTHLWRKNSQGT